MGGTLTDLSPHSGLPTTASVRFFKTGFASKDRDCAQSRAEFCLALSQGMLMLSGMIYTCFISFY